ncbi:hypothetical protein GRAN_4090 [Granulicella sibirica]|uniref:HEPN domain-containing protein n=1 Tax=Granulicella sibirica TaxID=2479048 RepID=A0A4Q0T0R9_9BACT|nr:hypothetical protein GRAN_4090 [Granulicella sibirica]
MCRRFLPKLLDQPLRDLLGEAASQDLQMVALHFVKLQDARHSADYDLSYELSEDDTWELFEAASDAVKAWKRIAHTAEANIFILSLLLWKNWDRDRL